MHLENVQKVQLLKKCIFLYPPSIGAKKQRLFVAYFIIVFKASSALVLPALLLRTCKIRKIVCRSWRLNRWVSVHGTSRSFLNCRMGDRGVALHRHHHLFEMRCFVRVHRLIKRWLERNWNIVDYHYFS